jgi:YgiT-type zinc finger domain-containing protein
MKQCPFCGGTEFKKTVVDYLYTRGGHYLLVEGVPCEKCVFCGEEYFRAEDLKRIEDMATSLHTGKTTPRKEIKVPVEAFA